MHQRIERHVAANNFVELVGAVSAQHGCLLCLRRNRSRVFYIGVGQIVGEPLVMGSHHKV